MFGTLQVPPMLDRAATSSIIPSGYKAIDAFFPLKTGHSCVISGEQGVGKSTLALNILRQLNTGSRRPLVTVLALVGKKHTKIASTVAALQQAGVLKSTIVIASSGEFPPCGVTNSRLHQLRSAVGGRKTALSEVVSGSGERGGFAAVVSGVTVFVPLCDHLSLRNRLHRAAVHDTVCSGHRGRVFA